MKCYITSQDEVLSIMANRTRILVPHALHVLDKTDYIYVMPVTVDEDIIVEKATYEVTIIPFFDDSDINLANPAIGLDGVLDFLFVFDCSRSCCFLLR
jgi:hypothetical protein